ncbi:MAG: chitobiase/beta-hexosaminidase C-terminal domain-containing protein, partial [Clostridia bacterium]|nr:chitobiase/beta-hexosaminidase C-terminal domain-containing protein [Clostridia bacterium]
MRKLLLTLLFICLLLPAAALAEGNVYFSHESGFYDDPIDLEILCDDPEALIYYTLDGTAPTLDSVIFDGALTLEDRTQEPNDLAALIGFSRNQFKTEVNVTKAHVIRAMAEYEDGSLSEIISGTFFVGVDREELYGDVPVISLMTDREGFFGYENGIYTMGAHFDEWNSQQLGNYEDWQVQGNFSQKGRDWERPVTVQFLTADGSEG